MIVISKELIRKIYKPVAYNTHKGLQGHVLLIGGSCGKIGSMCLSTKAALKSGCGLVTSFIPRCGNVIVQISIPEAMVLTDVNKAIITNIQFNFKPNAVCIGMGMGQDSQTKMAFHNFILQNKYPLVVDADGLNILSENKDWLSLLSHKTILTPHKKELERLIGGWNLEQEKIEKVIQLSLKYNLVIVIKGAPTFIVYGNTIFQNTTGNQALATAGSGDVLSGIITSLIAQGYESIDAALLGVYLHGLTADIGILETGYQAFIASDIIDYLGNSYLSIEKYDF
jgi:hydroxyethylthiazole kinase-like uncharacterized protein yjeF